MNTPELCLDQHTMEATAHDQQSGAYAHIVSQLQRSIEVPGSVLMLLFPFTKPIALTRVWCLYEVSRRQMRASSH